MEIIKWSCESSSCHAGLNRLRQLRTNWQLDLPDALSPQWAFLFASCLFCMHLVKCNHGCGHH